MKQILLVILLSIAFTSSLYAQDAIYTRNGNKLENARITDLTDERVMFTIQQSDKLTTHSFQRDNILVAFRNGNFLIIKNLSSDLTQAKLELQTFLTTTAWNGSDYLLRAIPFEVIPAKISYENDAVVNYLTNEGKSASISKGELIAIFYNDGHVSLIRDPSEAIQFLATLTKPIGSVNVPSGNTPPSPPMPAPSTRQATPSPAVASTPSLGTTSISNGLNNPTPSTAPINKVSLDASEYQRYRQKALDKVDEFANYLEIITNKSLSTYDRNQAINQAASLFMPAATIEVTSNSRPGARRYPIRTYLNNLKLLPYKSTKIEWTQVDYLKELSQAADGNYYGMITGQQTFVGYGQNTTYTDVTPKNVRVKLEQYHMPRNGKDEVKWNLLLGSIGVSAQ